MNAENTGTKAALRQRLALELRAIRRAWFALLCLMLAVVIVWQSLRFWMDVELASHIMFVPLCASGGALSYVTLVPLRRRYSALVATLAEEGDKTLLDPLIASLQWPLVSDRSLLREAWEQYAAQIGPAQRNPLTLGQVRILGRVIGERWDMVGQGAHGIAPEAQEERILLALALVDVLVAAGQGLTEMERLARRRPRNEGQERIHHAILVAIPFIVAVIQDSGES